MAIPRKHALERVQSLALVVEEHLAKIQTNPGQSSIPHWEREIRNWLQQMEELLTHVGKKTAAEWQTRLQTYRDALQQ
jgi:hypothetical protein